MSITLEDFSLRKIVLQFCEFNSAVRNNRDRLTAYFWWASAGKYTQFKFILVALLIEKFAKHFCDLPHNKKFIIRENGEFAGIIGLDGLSMDAPRTEIWIFVTREYAGKHIASHALKLAEEYARNKRVNKIYARTKQTNIPAKQLFASNGYDVSYGCEAWGRNEICWYKFLQDKSY